MRIALVGCGSIGQRHARNLCQLGEREIVLYDSADGRAAAAARECGGRPVLSIAEALERADLALICTPPSSHVPIAMAAIDSGSHVFIEKPLSHSLEGVHDLLQRARELSRSVLVGYNLRFHQALRRVKEIVETGEIGRPLITRAEFGQFLPDWRSGRDYRDGYNAMASMGGGVILDVSHEIDYVLWLAGEASSVFCAGGHLSSLEMDVEDAAAITLKMRDGGIAEVHVDSIQRSYTRQCKIVGENGTIFWDYAKGVQTYRAETRQWDDEAIRPDPNTMYVEEMRHLLSVVRGESLPVVDGWQGLRVLEAALAARRSLQTGSEVAL